MFFSTLFLAPPQKDGNLFTAIKTHNGGGKFAQRFRADEKLEPSSSSAGRLAWQLGGR
jgi:hypothetical protein